MKNSIKILMATVFVFTCLVFSTSVFAQDPPEAVSLMNIASGESNI